MKYVLLFCCLSLASCAPKYTASFQDYSRIPKHDQPAIGLQKIEIVRDALDTTKLSEVTASVVTQPAVFKREVVTFLSADTVIAAKQDTILLKNGEVVVGQITTVTANKLICQVSEWKKQQSDSKQGTKPTEQIIYLNNVFLIKYANGNNETVNFTKKSDPTIINPKRNAYALVALILGILSFFPLWGVFLAPIAIASSIMGLKSQKSKAAKAGLAIGIVGLILGVYWWVIFFDSFG